MTKFFERHCNILIYKKLSTIELIHKPDSLIFHDPVPYLYYKGQRIGQSYHDAERLKRMIILKYYDKLNNMVTCFNKVLEKFSLPNKVVLYDKNEYYKCSFSMDHASEEYYDEHRGNYLYDIFEREGLGIPGKNYDIIQ
jgi:hypothetical protein